MSDGTYATSEPPAGRLNAPGPAVFPALHRPGPAVNASEHVVAGTVLHTTIAFAIGGLSLMVLGLTTMGIGWLALLIAPIADWFLRRRVLATMKATSLEVGPHQLPEVYACAAQYAARLGMKETPRIFIVEGNTLNAAAARLGARHVVHLVDDVVWGALKGGDPQALSFIIGHELAHHALGHTGGIRTYLANAYRRLSRLDEFTADAVALQLLGEREGAYNGLVMLMVGPQLMPYVNRDSLFKQAAEADADAATNRAERAHTHPFLARRIHHLRNVRMAGAAR